MFPALKNALRDWWNREPEPVIQDYGLKAALLSFTATDAEWYKREGYDAIFDLLAGTGPTHSGETVTPDTAQNYSVVWACERIISESVAFLPLSLMRKRGESRAVAEEHPIHSAVHNAPNEEMTAMTWRETTTSHIVMRGNGYGKILRRSGTGTALGFELLKPGQVVPDRDKRNRLVYVVGKGTENEKTYTVETGKPHDILHIPGLSYDGIQGYNVISVARHSIGAALATDKYASKFFATGGRMPGFFEVANRWKTQQDADNFRADMQKLYGSNDSYHKMVLLEPGITFKPGGWSPQDSQFLQTRQFNPAEICRWFLIQPHMVGDLSRATFNNIEQLALQFVTFTLTAWLKRWEENLWRCVLTPDEKGQGYYFKHNLNALVRGDFLTRMQGHAVALQNAISSPNEVRGLEDLDPYEGGDDYHIQLNMQTLGNGTPTASQQAALVKVGSTRRQNAE